VRVIHVAPTIFGAAGLFGGGERYPLELARALANRVECELVTFGPRPTRIIDRNGLRLRVLRPATHLGGHVAHPVAPQLVATLAGADLVHTHHMLSAPSRLAAVTARLRRQRLVVTDHGLVGGDWGGLLPRLFDRFLTVSAFSARILGVPAARTRLIYGGADPARFWPDPSITRRGALFVGRLTPHKGVDRLIEALPPGAELRIAGSSGHDRDLPERDYPALLQKLAIGRQVNFLGAVADEQLPACYRSATVLVLPSVEVTCYGRPVRISELLGLVLLEAMMSGTPIIASGLGGIPEIVEHGRTGYLVEPGNVPELRERLAELLGKPELAARLGRQARERALDRYTWQACAERCLTVYNELLEGTQSVY
jgi:glycosyltransferase involved in cell wall biosynthesis